MLALSVRSAIRTLQHETLTKYVGRASALLIILAKLKHIDPAAAGTCLDLLSPAPSTTNPHSAA
jgi:hypothetical protein